MGIPLDPNKAYWCMHCGTTFLGKDAVASGIIDAELIDACPNYAKCDGAGWGVDVRGPLVEDEKETVFAASVAADNKAYADKANPGHGWPYWEDPADAAKKLLATKP